MSPIRIGIIGLSTSTTGTSWATKSHYAYLRASPKYTIVAVCNSSVESAQRAIKAFDLPADAKAYGNPEDLAADANVQLVVCSTRVDKHAEGVLPALRAGKDVFCEWPLTHNLAAAEEVVQLARDKGVRTMIGLQGRVAPVVYKVKELVESGKIGQLLSTTFVGSPGNGGADESRVISYFTDREIGGNVLTIHFGHSMDFVLHALGDLEAFNSILANQRKTINIVDREANTILEKDRPKTTFDQFIVQGTLQSKSDIKPVLSYHLRGGKPFPSPEGQPALLWRIYGTTGEIQVTASGPMFNVGYEDIAVHLFDTPSGQVEKIELEKDEFLDGLPLPGRNIGKLYDLYAEGSGYPDFEDALRLHKLIGELERRADSGNQTQKADYLSK